jgi:hypothetical protein
MLTLARVMCSGIVRADGTLPQSGHAKETHMKPTTKILIGAAAALSAGPALASPPAAPAVPAASSYAELLQPISDPVARLQAAETETPPPRLIEAQYNTHHHHHYRHRRRYHHHHHHQGYAPPR